MYSCYYQTMHIAIVYNARPENIDRSDPKLEEFIEGDEWRTILAIGEAIIKCGHSVSYITVDNGLYKNLEKSKEKIDLILNLAEGMPHIPDREAQLPMLAETLQIPYTGPGPLSSALILNKYRTKQIWRSTGVATAASQLFNDPNTPLDHGLKFPLIVKPNGDGSGVGIHHKSIVKNVEELKTAVGKIHSDYHQDALAETYLSGREFTVAIVGNGDDLTALPIIEINFAGLPQNKPAIDSYEAKFVYGVTGVVPMHGTEICPAQLAPELENKIVDLAKLAYTTIGCLDFGRIDIRLDEDENPYVLEINHPPGMMSDPHESSFFTIAAREHGWDFATLIGIILHSATTRLKI